MNNPLPEWLSFSFILLFFLGLIWFFIFATNSACKKLYGEEWKATGAHNEFCVNINGDLKGR